MSLSEYPKEHENNKLLQIKKLFFTSKNISNNSKQLLRPEIW